MNSLKRKIRFFWQRITRGFDDSETWSLDVTLARWLLPRFKRFRTLAGSTPMLMSELEWKEILDKIQFSLESAQNEDFYDMNPKVQEGFALMGRYLMYFWW